MLCLREQTPRRQRTVTRLGLVPPALGATCCCGWWALLDGACGGSFSFLYLKKIKFSKIYGRFENFQNYTPVAHWLGDRT